MHVGKTYPYDLTVRTFMGQFTYPNWARASYEAIPAIVLPWFGPDSGQITNAGPYTIVRDPSFELSPYNLVYAGYVQTISSGVVYVGFDCWLNSTRTQLRTANQVWLSGAPQLDSTGNDWLVFSWSGFASGTLTYPLLPGARVGCRITTYNAVPW